MKLNKIHKLTQRIILKAPFFASAAPKEGCPDSEVFKTMIADIANYDSIAQYLQTHRSIIEQGSVLDYGFGSRYQGFLEWVVAHPNYTFTLDENNWLHNKEFRFLCKMALDFYSCSYSGTRDNLNQLRKAC